MQLALCEVPFPRLRGQSACPLYAPPMMQQMQLPLPPTPSESDSQNESGSCAPLGGGWRRHVFTCSFHPPRRGRGEEGNHCHRSRCSTKAPDCILDPDMLFFFLARQGNRMFWRSVTGSLADCPPPPKKNVLQSNSALVPCPPVCTRTD